MNRSRLDRCGVRELGRGSVALRISCLSREGQQAEPGWRLASGPSGSGGGRHAGGPHPQPKSSRHSHGGSPGSAGSSASLAAGGQDRAGRARVHPRQTCRVRAGSCRPAPHRAPRTLPTGRGGWLQPFKPARAGTENRVGGPVGGSTGFVSAAKFMGVPAAGRRQDERDRGGPRRNLTGGSFGKLRSSSGPRALGLDNVVYPAWCSCGAPARVAGHDLRCGHNRGAALPSWQAVRACSQRVPGAGLLACARAGLSRERSFRGRL
jgi:hypothetical protein